jgi:hypothetical protein
MNQAFSTSDNSRPNMRRLVNHAFSMRGSVSRIGIKDNSRLCTRRWRMHAFSMLGFVSHMGIKVDQEPHSQSTVGTSAPAVAAALVPPPLGDDASTLLRKFCGHA